MIKSIRARAGLSAAAMAFAILTAGCAGRAPAPVPVVQLQDQQMDCAAISAEAHANTQKMVELGSESGAKVAQNVAAGVAGLIIWPLWFAMDFQGAADKETAALQSRQSYLATLAAQRGCAGPGPVATSATSAAVDRSPSHGGRAARLPASCPSR